MLLSSLSLSTITILFASSKASIPFPHTFYDFAAFPNPWFIFFLFPKKKKKKKQKELEECIDLGIPTLLDDEAVRP